MAEWSQDARPERCVLIFFSVNYHVACLLFFKAQTYLILVWLLVLHEKINKFAFPWCCRLRLNRRFGLGRNSRYLSNGSRLVGYRNKLVLLSDNESGVLLCRPTVGARLPNRIRAGLCFKLLCVSLSDNPMWVMRHLNRHSSYIVFFHQRVRT